MTVHLSSPAQLMQPAPYHHVSVATGARHVHLAGQVARDATGAPTADDLAGQVVSALRNVAVGLGHAGASFADVTRLTIYVVDWRPERMGDLMHGIEAASAELGIPTPIPPATLIGVHRLYEPDVLVEIEAAAVTD